MNLLSILLTISFMIIILTQGVLFYKETVCRQELWLLRVEAITEQLLPGKVRSEDQRFQGCKMETRVSLALRGKL